MATLEQLKQALYNADQAGDFEAASTLAAAIQNMQSTVQGPPNRPGEVTPPKKEYTLGEQIIGGLEADAALFTGMTSGAVGYISGVIEGLGDQALKGQWKPEEILQTAEKGAAKFTYEPKTEAGKEITQRVGGMLTAADFMGPSPTGMFGDIIHPELTPAAAMAKGEQVIQKTAPIVKKAVPLVEKTIEKTTGIFKKELPKTQEEVTSVIQKASRGDKKAQQIIKEIAPFDKEAFDASQRLGIDLPISEFIKNDETAKTVGLSRSQVGSHEEAMFKQDVINTAKIADETIQALGNATDLATISEQVKNDLTRARQSLKDQERVLYTKVDESVPKDTYVNAPTLNDILTQTAKELGGEERLTASEKNLLALSRSETLTYGALLRVKNDIGGSLGKTSMFPDINEAQLGKIYNAIKEDQRLAVSDFAGENALADLQLANTLTVKRKALEDNIVSGFGRKGTGSISRLIENAIKSGSKGDVTNLNKLLSIVPIDMQRDVIATALKDLSTSKKAGNLGEFDFTNYAKTYEGLRQNAPIYNTVIKTIGEDKAQILQDLYSVSRTINEAKGNVLHTGKANQAILQTLKGNTIMQNIVGKIIGWGTQKLTAGLVSPDFLFKTPQDKLQAIADLMRNPDFKQMIVEAAKGKVNPETMAKVVKTDAYKAAAKDVRVEETPPQTVKQKVEAKRAEKAKPTKDEVKKKVEEKKAEKKPIDAKEEARKEIKNNEYLDAYKELILESGKATTKAERNKSHGWFDVTVKDDFGQDVATQRIAGQRDITEAFTADKASIDRFMKGKATEQDLRDIQSDLRNFEASSDLRDEAAIIKSKKDKEPVELSDGTVYDPYSNMAYSKKEWEALQEESLMFSKGEDKDLIVQHNLSEQNLKHAIDAGGVPVPSLAITKKNTPLTGFGEITLLGDKNLADPKGYAKTKVFGADIYSPRHPKEQREYKSSDIRKMDKELEEYSLKLKSGTDLSTSKDIAELYDNKAMQMKFLEEEKGIKLDIPTKKNPNEENIAKFYFEEYQESLKNKGIDWQSLYRNPAFQDKVVKDLKAKLEAKDKDLDPIKAYGEDGIKNIARDRAQTINQIGESQGKPDFYAMRDLLNKEIEKYEQEYQSYVDRFREPYSYKSFFYADGKRKAYNPDAILKHLTTNLRGGENFNYGAGSVRAIVTPEFKSIEQIKANKEKLITPENFEKVKEEANNELLELADSIAPKDEKNQFIANDRAIDFIQDYAKKGKKALKDHNINVTSSDLIRINEFFEKLKNLPTEYFEAKITRTVQPSEFHTAIVPEKTNPETIKYLEKQGLKIKIYADEADRAKVIREAAEENNLLFSKGKNSTTVDVAVQKAKDTLGKAYDKATKDMVFVQSVEDLPQNIKDALYSIQAYHGTMKQRTKIGADSFFTNKPEYAEQYAGKDTRYYPASGKSEIYFMNGGQIYPAKIETKNFKTVSKAETMHDPKVEKQIIAQAKEDGFDGLIIKYGTSGREDYVPFSDKVVSVGFGADVLKSGGKARGIFDPKTGKAYIIADAMKANEVEGVILHELLHKNINNEVKAGKSRAEAIMGSRYESVVKRLDNLYKMGDKQVKDAFQKVTDANTPAQHRIEEVMTYLLENITNESKPLLIKWKDDVIAAIKAFIAKTALQLGMKAETVMNKLNSNDIANILRSEAIKNESMLKNIKR